MCQVHTGTWKIHVLQHTQVDKQWGTVGLELEAVVSRGREGRERLTSCI
jgi:hypothetical protein